MNDKIRYQDDGCMVLGVFYTKEHLYDLYISQNVSQNDLSKQMGISRGSLIKIINHFQLFKDSEIIKENRKQAIINKYGVDSVMKVPGIKEKSQQKIIEKYGGKSPLVNEEVKKKTEKTMLKKYGVRYPSQSSNIIQQKKENYFNKYGVYSHYQRDIKNFDIWSDDVRLEGFLKSFETKPTYEELAEYFNVDRTAVNGRILHSNLDDYVNVRPGTSVYEKEIVSFLHEDLGISLDNIKQRVTGLLGDTKQEIDIFLPMYNFGIEFNGNYWHSDIFHTDHSGRSTYHQQKSLLAEEHGIFLFHIFEYEWKNLKIKENICSRLKIVLKQCTNKIAARNCEVVELTKQQKKNFLNQYHIQGNDHCSKSYGLKYNGEIISCMTFTKPKNKQYTWELSRFCSKHDYIIQGGASKLFKYFIKDLNKGDIIVSYNDITKTQGKIYKLLGFSLKSINDPNYIWINIKTEEIRSRYQEQQAGETKRMHNLGYNRLCDCGTKTWVYKIGG